MSRKEREREKHCREIGCFYYKRCSVKWGVDCARNGGKKIPRFREKRGRRHRGFLVITGGPGEEVRVRRVANGKQGSEDPWQDIAGYGLLGAGE
ncbi:MAG: hypothetical protein PHO01_12915 [Desulfotomaculaceae bacterium]|nr:hypothetical protein [Desulfotomaculaceae bacterium]